MAIINIETATTVCSVAITEGRQVVFERVAAESMSHASLLGVFVEEAVKESKSLGLQLNAVAVSSGPGSYTGLRIGVSMAKGLCFGWDVPLISVSTLDIIASKVIRMTTEEVGANKIYCAMLDARRMEVYAALYDGLLRKVRDTEAEIVTTETYASFLEKQQVYFFGNGADKCKDVITSPNAVFVDGIDPLASDMALFSAQAYMEEKFEDTAYFEPFYLKDFVATVAKNKVLSEK